LFHKDSGVERFDELVGKVPEIDPGEVAKNDEEKPPEDKGKQPAVKGVIDVGVQGVVIPGQLTPGSERDPGRGGHLCKSYPVSLKAGRVYPIDMISSAFDAYLRLEAPNRIQVAADDDSGGALNARIVYIPPADGVYRISATTYRAGAVGPYTLRIQQ